MIDDLHLMAAGLSACFSLRVEYSLLFLDRIAMFIGVGSVVFTHFFLQRKSSSFLLYTIDFFW
jgi:hypothetical protein